MQSTTRKMPPEPRLSTAQPCALRVPRPTPSPRPTSTVRSTSGLQEEPDLESIRRELDQLARQCRAMADKCEAAHHQLDSAPASIGTAASRDTEPSSGEFVARAAPRQDTRPDSEAGKVERHDTGFGWEESTIRTSDILPWDEDETTASGWSGSPSAARPVSALTYPAVAPTPPQAPMNRCRQCGHLNGTHFFSCTACGCRLPSTLEALQAERGLPAILVTRLREWVDKLFPGFRNAT